MKNYEKHIKDSVIIAVDIDGKMLHDDNFKTDCLESIEYLIDVYKKVYPNKFVILDEGTQDLLELLEPSRKPDINKSFKNFKNCILNSMEGELYIYIDRIYDTIKKVNSLRDKFEDTEKLPNVIYKMATKDSSTIELDIKNIEEIKQVVEPGVLMYASAIFLEKAKNDYKKEKKSTPPNYQLSKKIKVAEFDDETQKHHDVPRFKENNASLDFVLIDGLNKQKSFNDILKIVNDVAKVKKSLNVENKKTIKQ